MKINIFSRQEAIRISASIDEPTLIISISCPGDTHATFSNNPFIKKILYLEFFDVEEKDTFYKSMNDTQAHEVVKVVNEYCNEVTQIIVNCDAGRSRSAGVAAAISLYLNGNNNQIFGTSYFSPNYTCYQKTLKAFGIDRIEEAKLAFNQETLNR